jgi:hypothetical protein
VQILESTMLGLRAARHRLTSPGSPVSVTLFPMVHVGEPAFFSAVYDDAYGHDVVLVEGVRSPVVRHLTSSYRWIDLAKLGLVVQPRHPPQEAGRARIVHADLTADEFHAEWRNVPLWLRIASFALAPAIGLKRRLCASRESLAGKMTMEDRLSSEEIMSWDPKFAAFRHSLLGARDARLVERLREALDRAPPGGERRLAIVYGAQHMRAVLAELNKRGFRSVASAWQTVMSF